ncbi:MAG: T9SS type A sorting domain-containing protein [Flavobacteriales bacterium]|nr:T9SS type A sorting domain-containing protein [Flavobacteriales bacterium]
MPTPNSAIDLQALVNGQYDRPAAWAQNLLCFGYGRCRSPRTGGRAGEPRRFTATTQRQPEALAQQRLWAQPNPASQYTEIFFKLAKDPDAGSVTIYDVSGREVIQFQIGLREGVILWDTRSVEPGTYSVVLYNGSERSAAMRIAVNP